MGESLHPSPSPTPLGQMRSHTALSWSWFVLLLPCCCTTTTAACQGEVKSNWKGVEIRSQIHGLVFTRIICCDLAPSSISYFVCIIEFQHWGFLCGANEDVACPYNLNHKILSCCLVVAQPVMCCHQCDHGWCSKNPFAYYCYGYYTGGSIEGFAWCDALFHWCGHVK
jgi:hypothetical protein